MRNERKVFLSADMRYAGQAYEINLPWDRDFTRRFHQLHEARFGHCDVSKEVEVVTLRVRFQGHKIIKDPRPLSLKKGNGKQAFLGQRNVYFEKRLLRCSTDERERG